MAPITTDTDLPTAVTTAGVEATATATAEKGDGAMEEVRVTQTKVGGTSEDPSPTTTTTTTGGTSPPPPPPTQEPVRDIEAIKAAALAAATQPTVKKTTKSKPQVMRKVVNVKAKGKKGKRSAPPRPTLVVSLGPNDVLMGRGSLFADYEGNVRLRAVVQDHRDAYAASSKHKDKQQIVRSIIDAVKALGGRFLRRVEFSKEQKKMKDASGPPSHMWSVIEDEKLVVDKVKQLFRDARLTRRMRRRRTPMEGEDLPQTEITSPNLTIPPGEPDPPGVTAPPGSVERQLQLQRLQQQQQQQQQEKNPLEEQLRQQQKKQSSLDQQIRLHKQTLKQHKKKGASNKAASSSPEMMQQQQQQQLLPQLQIPPNLQGHTGGMGMNIPHGMNHLGGMNFNTGDIGQQFGVFQLQQQEQLAAFRAEQERQELALRAEQMRQEQERQELALRAEQMRQEQERQGLAILSEQDRQQHESLRQQQEFQAFRAEQERQELANLLRANQTGRNDSLRQFAAAQQPMGMMQNQDTAFPGSFGAFPPDSLNRGNNQGVGRSGLVDLARLAEIMQVTGPFPNQFNNQGGQQM